MDKARRKRITRWIFGTVVFGSIVAVAAAIIFPVFASAHVARVKTGALSNVKQANTALMLYLVDNNDRYPARFSSHDDVVRVLSPYCKSESIFVMTGGEPLLPNPNIAGMKASEADELLVVMSAQVREFEGKVLGLADGSVRWSPDGQPMEGVTYSITGKAP